MQELIHNLGLDWKLFLAQATNFFIVLVVLKLTIYKPLLDFLAKRKKKIEEGIAKSEEADRRLHEIGEIKKNKIKEAEEEVVKIMKSAESRAKEETQRILDAAAAEEVGLMKNVIAKTVEMDPRHIDEALIEKTLKKHIPA